MTLEERRRMKYPETSTFHYYNANPKNKITTDCVIRAISRGANIPYNQVVMELASLQCATGYDSGDNALIDRYLQSKGFVKNRQPRKADNTKYTGAEFCEKIATNFTCIANLGGNHIVAIVDGKVNDTWNSTYGCIGNYWTRK